MWLAKWRGVEVALKEVLNPTATDTAAADVFGEAEKLASLQHPCVMAFYGVVTSPGNCATVAEYICHGSLRSGLAKIKRKVRSHVRFEFVGCSALLVCHGKGMCTWLQESQVRT